MFSQNKNKIFQFLENSSFQFVRHFSEKSYFLQDYRLFCNFYYFLKFSRETCNFCWIQEDYSSNPEIWQFTYSYFFSKLSSDFRNLLCEKVLRKWLIDVFQNVVESSIFRFFSHWFMNINNENWLFRAKRRAWFYSTKFYTLNFLQFCWIFTFKLNWGPLGVGKKLLKMHQMVQKKATHEHFQATGVQILG